MGEPYTWIAATTRRDDGFMLLISVTEMPSVKVDVLISIIIFMSISVFPASFTRKCLRDCNLVEDLSFPRYYGRRVSVVHSHD